MKKSYKVSIIMPSLNVAEYIDECIRSALNQTLFERELICIDAGSTDGTWKKLLFYANHPKYKEDIRLLRCNIKSYGYQVNLGIHTAVGEYIAILETDDYVEANMYEELYNIGISNNADYVKADYDTFITYSSGKRVFDHVSLFRESKEQYGKVINPGKNIYLYAHDHSIWKGIYKREFLLNYNIQFNESKGAAFQDIGFTQQVLSCAKKVVYINQSFYRYRKDRGDASIKSIHGLKYSYEEFLRLLKTDNLNKKIICIDGLFVHMVLSFECELIKTLRGVEYNADSEIIKPYYVWFKKQIIYAISSKLLTIDLYQECPNLRLILENLYEFSLKLKKEDSTLKRNRKELLQTAIGKNIIVFGSGNYGGSIIKYLYEYNINIHAICDSNRALWGTKKYDLFIHSPAECVKKFAGDIYVIASKKYSKEMKKQLLDLGIEKNHIYIYSTGIV